MIKKPERVQRCHRINNLLVNQTATSPEPPSASPSEHIRLQLGSYRRWGGGAVSQWRICSIISLFSRISALPQLPHYHTHKLRAKSIISYSFSPSAELIWLLINTAASQILLLTAVSHSHAKSEKNKKKQTQHKPSQSCLKPTNGFLQQRNLTLVNLNISPFFFPPQLPASVPPVCTSWCFNSLCWVWLIATRCL